VKKSTWVVKYSILKCSFSHPDYTVGLGVAPSPPVIEGSVRTVSIQTGHGLTYWL
jgi:hypothetical protein